MIPLKMITKRAMVEIMKKFFSIVILFIFLLSACVEIGKISAAKAESEAMMKDFKYADETGAFLLYMEKGASVRIGRTERGNGIRFSAKITEEKKLALDNEYGEENVTYGMLIAKLDNVQKSGTLSGETVFGENAVYNWAEDGNYTPESGKTRITNLTISSANLAKENNDYIVRGSITGILDKNLTVERVARAYVRCRIKNKDVYYFSDFKLENARSIVYVADNAILKDDDLKSQSKEWIFDNYIMKAVNKKREKFESAECSRGEYTEAEKAYEEFMLLVNSLSEENYAACFSAADTKAVNAKIDALYSAKADSYELVKNVSAADVIKPTPANKGYTFDESGKVLILKNDGFYISNDTCSITTDSGGDVWVIDCSSTNNKNRTLVFPLIAFNEYDEVRFELAIRGMKCASVFGGEISADATAEIRLVNEGTKLSCYAGEDKISEASDTDIIYGRTPFTMEFIECGGEGLAKLGTIKGEKFAYDTTTEAKEFNVSNLEVSAVPDCFFNINDGKLSVPMSSGNVSIYLPKNDFRENRDVSFDLFFNEYIENVKLGDTVLGVSGQNKHVDIKYLSGENLAVYVNGEQVSVIKDFEIVSGEKSFEIGLEGSESGVLIIGKISYTKYNRQSVSENVSFNSEKIKRKAIKGKMAGFKQGIYSTNCVDMTSCETAEIGSGLCIELLKNKGDSAEIYLPSLDFSKIGELRLELATEKIGTVSINGNPIMYGGENCYMVVKYSKEGSLTITFDIKDSTNQPPSITITDPSIINGEAGLMIKINGISDGAKVYVSDLTLNGIKTYSKMRLPA